MYSVFSIIIYAVLLEVAFLWAIEHLIYNPDSRDTAMLGLN